jgi:hypothetical protein
MSVVWRKLRTWSSASITFLKINWLFLFLISPTWGIYREFHKEDTWGLAINFLCFALIFSSAMSLRTSSLILQDLRHIGDRTNP